MIAFKPLLALLLVIFSALPAQPAIVERSLNDANNDPYIMTLYTVSQNCSSQEPDFTYPHNITEWDLGTCQNIRDADGNEQPVYSVGYNDGAVVKDNFGGQNCSGQALVLLYFGFGCEPPFSYVMTISDGTGCFGANGSIVSLMPICYPEQTTQYSPSGY